MKCHAGANHGAAIDRGAWGCLCIACWLRCSSLLRKYIADRDPGDEHDPDGVQEHRDGIAAMNAVRVRRGEAPIDWRVSETTAGGEPVRSE